MLNFYTSCRFSEVGGRTGCRMLVRDAAGETESALLHEAVPSWVADVVIDRNIPRFIKIPFFLLPHPQMAKQDRMKKVNDCFAKVIMKKIKKLFSIFLLF